MKINSLETLFHEELKDIYDAEKRLTKALPKMMKAAKSEELKAARELFQEAYADEPEKRFAQALQKFERVAAVTASAAAITTTSMAKTRSRPKSRPPSLALTCEPYSASWMLGTSILPAPLKIYRSTAASSGMCNCSTRKAAQGLRVPRTG